MCTPASSWLMILTLLPLPARSPAVDLGGHRVQERLGDGPRRIACRAHHGHLARCGLGRAARDRRIDVVKAHGLEAALEGDRDVGVDGRAHHEDAARLHRRCGAAAAVAFAGAEQHGLGLRRVDDDRDNNLAARGELGRRLARRPALRGERRGDAVARVADVDVGAGAAQRSGHARAHRAQADQAHPAPRNRSLRHRLPIGCVRIIST